MKTNAATPSPILPETNAPLSFVHLVTGHFIGYSDYKTWRSRGTTDWLLIYTQSGAGRFGDGGIAGGRELGENSIIATAGDAVLLRPNTPHDYGAFLNAGEASPHWEILWTHFHPPADWQPLLSWPEATSNVDGDNNGGGPMRLRLANDSGANGEVLAALKMMHDRATGALPGRERFAMNALETALLWCDAANPLSGAERRDARVQRAADWLCRNLQNGDADAGGAARCVALSVSRLSHLFREQTGETVAQFLERERITRACQLLEVTDESVGAIARTVGYDDPFYFSNRFKRRIGKSPRDWRQTHRR